MIDIKLFENRLLRYWGQKRKMSTTNLERMDSYDETMTFTIFTPIF